MTSQLAHYSHAHSGGENSNYLHCQENLMDTPSTSQYCCGGGVEADEAVVSKPSCAFQRQQQQHQQHQQQQQRQNQTLNSAQRQEVGCAYDRTIFADDRCLQGLLDAEERVPTSDYFKLATQFQVKPYMRQMLCDWLLDMCVELECDADVYPLTVSLVDRFLGIEPIYKEQLQSLGAACFLIAHKLKATTPSTLKTVSAYTDNSVSASEIMNWEFLVLSRLRWDVATPTAFDFLDQMTSRCPGLAELHVGSQRAVHRLQRAYELAMLLPSLQACICLLYAAQETKKSWLIELARQTVSQSMAVDLTLVAHFVAAVELIMHPPQMLDENHNIQSDQQQQQQQQQHLQHQQIQTTPQQLRHHHMHYHLVNDEEFAAAILDPTVPPGHWLAITPAHQQQVKYIYDDDIVQYQLEPPPACKYQQASNQQQQTTPTDLEDVVFN